MASDAEGVAEVHPVLLEHHRRVHGLLELALDQVTHHLGKRQPDQVQQAVLKVDVGRDATADEVVHPHHQQWAGPVLPLVPQGLKVAPSLGADRGVRPGINQGLGDRVGFSLGSGCDLAAGSRFPQLVAERVRNRAGGFVLKATDDLFTDVDRLDLGRDCDRWDRRRCSSSGFPDPGGRRDDVVPGHLHFGAHLAPASLNDHDRLMRSPGCFRRGHQPGQPFGLVDAFCVGGVQPHRSFH